MESLVWRPAATLFTRLVPKVGGLSASLRGLGCRVYLKVTYFSPPRSGPCRARLPWRVRLWVGPPLAPLPRGVGGPLSLFLLFFPFFRVSVLFLVGVR